MVRTILISAVALSLGLSASAQKKKHIEMATGYNAAMPQGDMQNKANTVHGIELQILYLIPSNNKLGIGVQLDAGSYASFTRTQVFGFNGTSTPTNVNYNSNVTSGALVVKYNFIQTDNYGAFASVRGGMTNFTSKLEVEDPEDVDGCHPLETRNLTEDYTWQAAARVGATIDMHAFINRMPSGLLSLQGYAGYVYGGNVDYINVKKTSGHDHSTTVQTNDGKPVTMQFVNVSTSQTHDHEVARLYNSPVRFLEAGISLVIRF
jgi:hypothetical protein